MALAAGALVRHLAGSSADVSVAGLGPAGGATIALGGLVAAFVKLVSAVGAARARAQLVGAASEHLREEVLEARLAGEVSQPGHDDHGPAPKLATERAARDLAALTTHVREVELALDAGVLRAARALFELVPVAVALVLVDPWLAAGALLVLAPFGAALSRLRRGLGARQARVLVETESLLAAADDAVTHADLFRVYGAEDRARATVRSAGARVAELGTWVAVRGALLSSGNEVLGALALLAVVAGQGALPAANRAQVVPFSVVFFLAYKPMRDLSDARLAWSKGEAALGAIARAVGGVLGARGTASGGAPPPSLAAAPLDGLVCRGLVLAHVGGAPIDLTLAPGEIVGIVAPTGHGKTSLLRVLLGLSLPERGEVTYGARALSVELGPRERPFAWVPQDAALVAGTVLDNVVLGGRVDEAAARSALDSVSGGRLGARADGDPSALSGGERQWVALARALVSGRPILLLDEPTSGLDAESQTRVLEAISSLRGTRTVVLVTHRLEALSVCDRVYDLEARAFVERGPLAGDAPGRQTRAIS
jgi:ABC-type multidrug transport system fused ATPase/permease subunit